MRDSCGTGGQVRHLKVKRTNVAHHLPRGKGASETEINHFHEQQSLRKQPVFYTYKSNGLQTRRSSILASSF
ncbi:hypothetical protein QUF49_08695 [Fictibacillus sp. b24]|uniref:hypothetical protein n=1 Tax=unclassified Fictibacillus TaxID=2644029 RepID=UPI0025A20EED|nr:hypothetical protein [Fictibacillus sp. b24]MDM5316067.1 hypothetical protein [Fictibacillus sp. b24]